MKFRDLPAGFQPHTTERMPIEAEGRRVAVVLRNGRTIADPVNKDTPPGWAADGRQGCRWTHLAPDNPASQFDIMGYKVL
jgi:hypothetical protein